jgi:quinol monooxygenase YgiN
MIIIHGSIAARTETLDELLRLSLEHVRRSRLEPGCICHGVAQDAEDPLRLVFYEEWQDGAAVAAHFAVPESRAFVAEATRLAAAKPEIRLFEAQPFKP